MSLPLQPSHALCETIYQIGTYQEHSQRLYAEFIVQKELSHIYIVLMALNIIAMWTKVHSEKHFFWQMLRTTP